MLAKVYDHKLYHYFVTLETVIMLLKLHKKRHSFLPKNKIVNTLSKALGAVVAVKKQNTHYIGVEMIIGARIY